MVSCNDICESIISTFFTFKTPRLVRVRSFKIGLTFRLVQFMVLAYVIGFAIIYKKGYQETDKPESSVTAKENGAFFVMTHAIITPFQRFGNCTEDPEVSPCNEASFDKQHPKCPKDYIHPVGNGIMTGRCLQVPGTQKNACEIAAWCRVERDDIKYEAPLLPQAANFTVFIKNSIEFPRFQVKRNNLPDVASNPTYMRTCRYHHETDSACPVFTLGYITERAKADFVTLALKGGVINIKIEWDCNLDFSESKCTPVYKFSRLDDDKNKVSQGWNFRFANYYRTVNGDSQRDLIKAYGILFIFTVTGKAGKFSPVPLILNIGAGVALLSVAILACDFIILYVVKGRNEYQTNKFLEVMDKDFQKLGFHAEGKAATGDSAVMESTANKDFDPRRSFTDRQRNNHAYK